jgi:hypothetical protein
VGRVGDEYQVNIWVPGPDYKSLIQMSPLKSPSTSRS